MANRGLFMNVKRFRIVISIFIFASMLLLLSLGTMIYCTTLSRTIALENFYTDDKTYFKIKDNDENERRTDSAFKMIDNRLNSNIINHKATVGHDILQLTAHEMDTLPPAEKWLLVLNIDHTSQQKSPRLFTRSIWKRAEASDKLQKCLTISLQLINLGNYAIQIMKFNTLIWYNVANILLGISIQYFFGHLIAFNLLLEKSIFSEWLLFIVKVDGKQIHLWFIADCPGVSFLDAERFQRIPGHTACILIGAMCSIIWKIYLYLTLVYYLQSQVQWLETGLPPWPFTRWTFKGW